MKGRIILIVWLAVVVLLAILTSSCKTLREFLCKPDTVIIQDKYVPTPMSRLNVDGFVNCDQNGLAQMRSIIFVTQKDSFKGDVTDGKFSGVFTHKPDSAKCTCKNEVFVRQTNYLTGFQKFCVKWFWITAVLLLLSGIILFYRTKLKILQSKFKNLLN